MFPATRGRRGTLLPLLAQGGQAFEIIPEITFGVEIELLIRSELPGSGKPDFFRHAPGPAIRDFDDYQPGDGRFQHDKQAVYTKVALALREAGLDAKPECETEPTFAGFTNDYEWNDGVQSYQQWWVTEDSSIDKPRDANHYWWQIEVVSPAYTFTRANLQEVQTAIEQLGSRFTVVTNRSCGIHVHVGHKHQGFRLESLQSLLQFFVAFEPQLDLLHPMHRRHAQHLWAGPLRYVSQMASDYNVRNRLDWQPIDVPFALDQIQETSDIGELIYLWGTRKNFTITPTNLQAHKNKKTLEFRQHASTLDSESVLNWINLVVRLVSTVESIPRAQLGQVLMHYGPNPGETNDNQWTILQLLENLGLHDSLFFYGSRLYIN